MITLITKQSLRLIKVGAEDEAIKEELESKDKKKRGCFTEVVERIILLCLCVFLSFCFVFSVVTAVTEESKVGAIPQLKVVSSTSMAYKYEGNKYLFDNQIDNQLQMFDVVVAHQLPDQMDLKLYDIVVYEVDNVLLIHRIVGIEEPNASHPNERHFLMQGDAVQYPDKFPARYDQMRAIYRDIRVPFVGTFVVFMQTIAGFLCFLLVVFAAIILPIIEKKLEEAKKERIAMMMQAETPAPVVEETPEPQAADEPPAEVAAEEISLPVTDETPAEQAEDAPVTDLAPETESPASTEEVTPAPVVVDEVAPATDDETDVEDTDAYAHLRGREAKTFRVRIQAASAEIKGWYREAVTYALTYSKLKFRESKRHFAIRLGNTPFAKFFVRGKTLCVALAAPDRVILDEKLGYQSVAEVKAHEGYTAILKISSARRLKNLKATLTTLFEYYLAQGKLQAGKVRQTPPTDIEICLANEVIAPKTNKTAHLTFLERLEGAEQIMRDRYQEIVAALNTCPKVKTRISRGHQTFRVGSTAIAKMAMRGKVLFLYLAIDPDTHEGTTYFFQDVSDVKHHDKFPMLIKLTSDRKMKRALELIARELEIFAEKVAPV